MDNLNMSSTTYAWNANDFSNIITISSAAVASVLLVIFKSRCKTINFCWGLIGCVREVKNESDEEENDKKKNVTRKKDANSNESSTEDIIDEP